MPINFKCLILPSFFLVSLAIDKIPHIIHCILNDSVLISECHIFGKADSQADYAGPQAAHKQCWKEKNEWEKQFPYLCLQKMNRKPRAKYESSIISSTFSAIIQYSRGCDF